MPPKEILIVEDEVTLLDLERIVLSTRGYKVEGVGDGEAALAAISRKKPDLVLLDIMLPKLNGFEVCRQIKSSEATRHIPVIMLTARKAYDDVQRGMQAGADWYMVKPFKSAALVETVQKFLS